jgi:exopolysaccharide biosynthesis polyprenyl glycosylphosphotransferase
MEHPRGPSDRDDRLIELEDRLVDLTLTDLDVRSPASSAVRAYRRTAWLVALTDGGAVLAAFVLAYGLRYGTSVRPFDVALALLLAPLAFVAVFATWRLYSIYRYAPAEEFRRLLSAISLAMAIVIMGSFWTRSSFSRLWIAYAWVLTLVFVLAERGAWHRWLARRRREGRLVFRTLVVGSNGEAQHIADVLREKQVGFEPIGFVPAEESSAYLEGLPAIGDIRNLRGAILASDADCLVVASSSVTEDQMGSIVRVARRAEVEIRISANLPAIHSHRVTPHAMAGVMTLALHPVRLTGPQAVIKRATDVVGASVGLVLFAPVVALVALTVRLTSRGSVLFRQQRITKGGRVFTMYKFRTMYDDVSKRLEAKDIETSVPFFKVSTADAVTPVGRYLRRFSLDELPQLWNVLIGDMSLVGPRPLPQDQVEANPELLGPRHELRTGLTGWWQVSGRSDVDPADAVRQDAFYIENWALALDAWILFKTIGVFLRPSGSR